GSWGAGAGASAGVGDAAGGGASIGGVIGSAPSMGGGGGGVAVMSNNRMQMWSVGPYRPTFGELVEASTRADAATRSAFGDLPQLPRPITVSNRPASAATSPANTATGHAFSAPRFPLAGNRMPRRYFHAHRRNRVVRRNPAAMPLRTTIVNDE